MVMMIDGITLRYQCQNMASLEISNTQMDVCSWNKSLNIIEPRFF